MPEAVLEGISTRYEVIGDGPALLMFSPGGFDSGLENWTDFGRYRELGFIEQLSKSFRCIVFDRRESGRSGGRLERLTWTSYVAQARALLDHLAVEEVHVMGGCVGCSTAALLALDQPGRVRSMVLFSPAGGARYRLAQHQRFARHLSFVLEHGMDAVVRLARETTAGFSADPRVGPWAPPLRTDEEFARKFAGFDVARYAAIVAGTADGLFDTDSVPGPRAEDLLALDAPALIVPGDDASHTRSAAYFLDECLPNTELWDVPVAEQTAQTAPTRVIDFLVGHS